MVFLQVAPEHVLHAISGIEDACAQAVTRFVQSVEQHALAIFMIRVALGKKCLIVEHLFVEGPGVLGQTQRGIGPEELCQINGVGNRMRDREIWASRIDIHGRDVDLDLRRQLLEVETANAVCAGAERSFELDRNPIGVGSNFQREFLRADCDASLIRLRTHLKRNTQLATGRACQRIRRPGDIRTAN